MDSFYASLLNIRNFNSKHIIKDIVTEQKSKVQTKTDNLAGLCKYMASVIESELREKHITTYWVDLNDIVGADHVILIAEYNDNGIKRILIDPTFEQFEKKERRSLTYLSEWPSEKIKDKAFVKTLLEDGLVDIDSISFSDYISGFSNEEKSIDLDEFLLHLRLDGLNKTIK